MRSECSNPAADPATYTGIGISFHRAIATDLNSPFTIAGLVPEVSPNEYGCAVKSLVPTSQQYI